MSRTNTEFLLIAIPLALIGTSAAFADTIVVRSNGPSAKSFPVGKSLPANAKLTLQNGDAVTILDAGGTRVFKGPGAFPIAATVAANGPVFGQFLRNTSAKIGRAGATRGKALAKPRSPNVWFVDVSRPGTVCVGDPASITLWRPQSTKDQTFTLGLAGSGHTVTIAFDAATATRPWPLAEMPVADGAQFTISGGGTPGPIAVTLRTGVPATATPDKVGLVLIKNGCSAQIDLLVETTAQSTEGDEAGG